VPHGALSSEGRRFINGYGTSRLPAILVGIRTGKRHILSNQLCAERDEINLSYAHTLLYRKSGGSTGSFSECHTVRDQVEEVVCLLVGREGPARDEHVLYTLGQ
jgi:hypothetical protein